MGLPFVSLPPHYHGFLITSSVSLSHHHNDKIDRTKLPKAKSNNVNNNNNICDKITTAMTSAALSVTLLLCSPCAPSFAFDSSFSPPQLHPQSPEVCLEEEIELNNDNVGVSPSPSPSPATNEGIVQEAWEIVNDSFLDSGSRRRWSPQSWLRKREDILSSPIKTRAKARDVIRRMLSSLGDPYTRFLPPAEFSKMARYDMTGIGINLREIPAANGNFKLKVLGLVLDGPAQTAGVRQGDEIISVNGEDVRGKSAFEVSSMLQGPNKTFVTVEVKHGSCGPVQVIKIQRELVARTPVFYRLEQLESDQISVGYVRLKEFNALARKDTVTAIKRLQELGASCFVLDLRDNFGGLVQGQGHLNCKILRLGWRNNVIAGIEIAKLFLNEGDTVIYTAGRDQSLSAVVAETAPLFSAPIMVLVNHNTASASEIVASALHDNCKAVLVGEKTFGKALIQSVFELLDGSGVVVTVGKYVTPGNLDINGNGIEPDFPNIPRWTEVTKHLSTCDRLK